jgi:hypothetical protein
MLTFCKPVLLNRVEHRSLGAAERSAVKQWSKSGQTVVKQWLNQALVRLMLASGTRGAGGAGGVPVQGNGGNSVATSYKLQQK